MIILFEYQLILTHCAEQWPPRPTTCIRTDTDHDLLLCFLGGENSDTPILQKLEKRKETTTILTFASDQGSDDGLTKVFFSSFFVTFTTFLAPPFCGRGSRKQDVAISRAQTTECKLRAVIANYEFLLLTQSVSALFYYFTRVFHFDEIFFNIFAKTLNHLQKQ